MSDKEDKSTEQHNEEAENTQPEPPQAEATVAVTPEPAPAVAAPPPAYPPPPPAKGSSGVAWFALLLIVLLAGAAGWVVMEGQRREAVLLNRISQLEDNTGREQADLEKFTDGWQRKLNQGLEEVRGEMGKLLSNINQLEGELGQLDTGISEVKGGIGKLAGDIGAVQGGAAEQARTMEGLDQRIADQRAELSRFSANDRESWLLAEASYLMRLANQRVIMAGDVGSAKALLASADKVLLELSDASLHDVRAAVASDLAALRAVPQLDLEGIYVRLSALIEQADKLKIFEMPEREEQPEAAPAEDWQDRLQQGYEEALGKLSTYIAIRRRDVPMEVLMDPQWEGLVRQNLRMLLEQAQVALLSGNQVLYRESLERCQHWVKEFFESDEAASKAMAGEISQLSALEVSVELPDVSRSLAAMDDILQARLQQGGGE